MINAMDHNCKDGRHPDIHAASSLGKNNVPAMAGTSIAFRMIRHLYVHIPFCARICPYCAFYKDTLDRSQTGRFCEAIVAEMEQLSKRFEIAPTTIFFGGGTPTALTTDQLQFVIGGFQRL